MMSDDTKHRITSLVIWCLILLAGVIFLKAAWMSDDAYITFRTVDNFLNGYGLRWNIDQRVQTYTHPLWMLVIAGAHCLTHEFYFTAIILSLIFSILTLVMLKNTSVSPFATIAVFIGLLSSKAFVDYTSSGLENALSYLLISIFGYVYLTRQPSLYRLGGLTLLCSLIFANRMDAILLILPCMLYVIWDMARQRKYRTGEMLKALAIGLVPAVLWLVFAVVYYGTPFPNTYYAKLHTGIPLMTLIKTATTYYKYTFTHDPVTLPLILTCLIIMGIYHSNKKTLASGIGILLYLVYILKIGGDFMAGRFFSIVLLFGLMSISVLDIKRQFHLILIVGAFGLGLWAAKPTYFYNINDVNMTFEHGIADERGYYYNCSGMLRIMQKYNGPICHRVFKGRALRKTHAKMVLVYPYVGFYGFFAGPDVHIIDEFALCDPLLARMEVPDKHHWRIGHFERRIPQGYVKTIETGYNQLENPNLKKLNDILDIITVKPVWSFDRFKKIVKLNLGYYDHLQHEY